VKMAMKLLGVPELQEEIDKVCAELREAEDPAALAAAEPFLAHWLARVPVLDGNYRDALVVAWLGKDGAAVGTRWLPELPREQQPFIYSKRLEFGTYGVRPQPSARPALEAGKREALEAGEVEFRSVVKGRKPRKRKLRGTPA